VTDYGNRKAQDTGFTLLWTLARQTTPHSAVKAI